MIRAIVFDFDGLILDTETAEYKAWQAVYQSYGCDLSLAIWTSYIGMGTEQELFSPHNHLEALLKQPLDRETVRTSQYTLQTDLITQQSILPGVETYLAEAKRLGLKVGLASSSGHEWVEGHLSRFGLIEHFECIRCSEDVSRTKPEPELYQAVLKAFDIQPQEAIALEDSANGVLAAKRAGMWCAAVPNAMTKGLNFDHADLRLESMAAMELGELIRRVEGKKQSSG